MATMASKRRRLRPIPTAMAMTSPTHLLTRRVATELCSVACSDRSHLADMFWSCGCRGRSTYNRLLKLKIILNVKHTNCGLPRVDKLKNKLISFP